MGELYYKVQHLKAIRGKAAGDLVAGADRLYALCAEAAQLAHHLPLDLREMLGKRQHESAAPEGKEPRSERNAGQIQQGKIDPQTGQVDIQPPGSRTLGSGYRGERPGQKQSLFCDRWTEFANWRRIEERLHCEVYFADPYCARQKGINENLNGLLREFYPKGRNLSRVSPATLKQNLALINARFRKVLNFHSAQELWDFELNSCCT